MTGKSLLLSSCPGAQGNCVGAAIPPELTPNFSHRIHCGVHITGQTGNLQLGQPHRRKVPRLCVQCLRGNRSRSVPTIFLRVLLVMSWKRPSRHLNETCCFSIYICKPFSVFSSCVRGLCTCPSCPISPEPPGSSLQHRRLFRPSAQHIREQQSVFFWSQRPPPLPAGSTKTRGHRQPVSGQHRPHEGKHLRYLKALLFVA